MKFSIHREQPKANPEKNQQIKQWVYQLLGLEEDITISLSQLQCKEPGCPPVETVITVMTSPVQKYTIHKPLSDIEHSDILEITE
ncbi:MAG: hypothetical protein SAL70_19675 [Scytonema sp. PMC 1070.18]|nr:hypothetical protein [Scytonema sp. PMC 1070.18]